MTDDWLSGAIEKQRGTSWWLAIVIVVCGGGFAIWFSIASLTPHTWVVPKYSELPAVVGQFYSPSWQVKNPYGFRKANGAGLSLSCYPELRENNCLTNSISLAGKLVVVRYFTIPRNTLIQHMYGSTPDILMEVQAGSATPLSYGQSAERLRVWGAEEDNNKMELLPIGLAASLFIAAIGAFAIYAKIKLSQDNE